MLSLEISAVSITPTARAWLTNSHEARVLHVFDSVCNLINERRDILSVVTPQIGNGPFNLVIEDDVGFSEHLNLQSPIFNSAGQLHLGDFTINTTNAKLWNPRPDWEMLHAKRDDILNRLTVLLITNYSKLGGFDTPIATTAQGYPATTKFQPLISNLFSALSNADIPTALAITSQLAGLGQGLTPAGDDFMMGAIYAAWIIHPPEVARALSEEITNVAAPLTTSLSAAWLRSAGKGEAGILWHQFFDSLISGDEVDIQLQIAQLLSVGHTSGADALAGFIGSFVRWSGIFCSDLRPKAIR